MKAYFSGNENQRERESSADKETKMKVVNYNLLPGSNSFLPRRSSGSSNSSDNTGGGNVSGEERKRIKKVDTK